MNLPSLFDLTGKTALVTGSSEGLGLAMARGLAAAGSAIILNGRDERKLANAAKSSANDGHKIETRPFGRCSKIRSSTPGSRDARPRGGGARRTTSSRSHCSSPRAPRTMLTARSFMSTAASWL